MKITNFKDGYKICVEEPETILCVGSNDITEVKSRFMQSIEKAFDKEMIRCVKEQLDIQ